MAPAIPERPRVLVLRTADQAAVTDAAVMMKLAIHAQLIVVIVLHLMTVQEAATLEAAIEQVWASEVIIWRDVNQLH